MFSLLSVSSVVVLNFLILGHCALCCCVWFVGGGLLVVGCWMWFVVRCWLPVDCLLLLIVVFWLLHVHCFLVVLDVFL